MDKFIPLLSLLMTYFGGSLQVNRGINTKYSSWTINYIDAPYMHCMVRSDNSSIEALCDRRYNTSVTVNVMNIWINYGQYISNLHLGCSLTVINNNGSVTESGCVCAELLLPIPSDKDIELTYNPCGYPSVLGADMFQGLTIINTLSIDSIPIQGFDNNTFDEFQNKLQFIELRELPLDENRVPAGLLCPMTQLVLVLIENLTKPFKEFPRQIFTCNHTDAVNQLPNLQGVFITGNQFSKLPAKMLGEGSRSVVALNLTANGIQEMDEEAFLGMYSLVELNLTKNSISNLPIGVFDSLGRLRYLDLSSNELNHVNTNIFSKMTLLQGLKLSNNRIMSVEGTFGILPRLNYLWLDYNQLEEIGEVMFNKSYQIGKLYLNHNNITRIHQDAFKTLLFIKALELKHNLISNATSLRLCFQGKMERLGYIGLSHNSLDIILDEMFQSSFYVHSLEILDLSFNEITEIQEDAFKDMINLQILDIKNNNLTSLHQNTFNRLPKLASMFLDSNGLEELPTDSLPEIIVQLALDNNNLKSLPISTKPLTYLMGLFVSNNKLTELSRSMFTNFPNLTQFTAINNSIEHLGELTFADNRFLSALDLSHNKLNLNFTIDYWGMIFKIDYMNLSHNAIESAKNLFYHHTKYPHYFDISYNPLRVFPNQPKIYYNIGSDGLSYPFPNWIALGYLYMRNCSLTTINPHAFELMLNLLSVDLSDNLLTEFRPLRIAPQNEEYYFVYLYRNPIKCSCEMQWLKSETYHNLYKLDQCALEMTQEVVPFKEVQIDQFMCEERLNCPVNQQYCACYTDNSTSRVVTYLACVNHNLMHIPDNIPRTTRILHLEGNNFNKLTFTGIPAQMETLELYLDNSNINDITPAQFDKFLHLEILSLSNNHLSVLKTDALNGLFRLKTLNLHKNKIYDIEPEFFRSILSLETLTLHENDLAGISNGTMVAISGLPYIRSLTFHDNPWVCPCDNLTFKSWLQEMSPIITNLNSIKCNGSSIVSTPDEDFLCYDTTVYLRTKEYHKTAVVATSTVATLIAIAIVLLVVSYIHREFLQVILYHKFQWRFKNTKEDDCTYDAFPVYTTDLRHWIRTVLLPELEPPFHLFITERDSLPGRVQTEEIMSTIQSSRRTLFFLTEDAVQNELFLYTFQTAYNHIAQESNHHRIVLVLMENMVAKEILHSDLDLDPHLEAFLKAKQYIHVEDHKFLEKLRFYMPDPPPSRDQGSPKNDVNNMDSDTADSPMFNISLSDQNTPVQPYDQRQEWYNKVYGVSEQTESNTKPYNPRQDLYDNVYEIHTPSGLSTYAESNDSGVDTPLDSIQSTGELQHTTDSGINDNIV